MSHRLPVALTLHDEWTFTGPLRLRARLRALADRAAGRART